MIIEYIENGNVAICNGYKFRRDKKTGYYLSSTKINGKRKRLHVYVWECEHGEIPPGYHVHHKDEDKGNNESSNFVLLTNRKHTAIHTNKYAENNRDKIVQNLLDNAVPASKEWHRSEAGRDWHKKQYERTKDRLLIMRNFTCQFCGKEFTSTQANSKFCSNKCKAAERRKSGIDDIIKICTECGREYSANKYQKTKYCPLCASRKRERNRQK